MRVLVTGGSGALGSKVVPRLAASGSAVRVMTHSGRRVVGADSVAGDLLTGAGLEAAVAGAECVVHLASSPGRQAQVVDVEGTRRLLEAAAGAGVGHFVYMSITGVDRLPEYTYYGHKLAAEGVVRSGPLPWSIVRATQFFGFIDFLLRSAASFPVMLLPKGFRTQPVEVGEVAARVIEVVARGPQGMLPEMGGPEIFTAEQIAAGWRRAHHVRRPLLAVPLPGKVARKFREGAVTCPQHRSGRITWTEWLAGARA